MKNWPNPFIEQRADPFILRHQEAYYFIASVPEYDRLEIRRAADIDGLRSAEPVVVWRKPNSGPMSNLIWAPSCTISTANGISTSLPPTRRRLMNWGCSSTVCTRSSAATPIR